MREDLGWTLTVGDVSNQCHRDEPPCVRNFCISSSLRGIVVAYVGDSPGRLTSRVTQMHIHETPIDEKIVRSDAWVCDRRRVSFIKPPAECRRFSALFID